jgi:predicted transcriptional regulator
MANTKETVEIVAAFLRRNTVPTNEVAGLIKQVGASLSGLHAPPLIRPPEPAVPIRRSVSPDEVICLECGWKGRMLGRHIRTHGYTEQQYRDRWGLMRDHALTAPNYTVRRSEIAKQVGLGRRRSTATKRAVGGQSAGATSPLSRPRSGG